MNEDDWLLDPNTPQEKIDAVLREAGVDPEEVQRRGIAFVNLALKWRAASQWADAAEAECVDLKIKLIAALQMLDYLTKQREAQSLIIGRLVEKYGARDEPTEELETKTARC